MSRPCREWGCSKLVKSRSQKGYCDDHASSRSGWNKRVDRTGSTTERGYGYQWQKLRKQILQRDNHLCVMCMNQGLLTEATDVDHKLNKAKGGTDDMDNLQSLCFECHKEKTSEE